MRSLFSEKLTTSLLAFALLSHAACFKRDVAVKVEVEAKTNQGDPVSGAAVKVEKETIGETDNLGRFSAVIKAPANSRRAVEVSKQSEVYYFAPHVESFSVLEGPEQSVKIAAMLYFVPKPSAEDATKLAMPDVPPAPSPPSDTGPQGDAPAEAKAEAVAAKPEEITPPASAGEEPKPDVAAASQPDAAETGEPSPDSAMIEPEPPKLTLNRVDDAPATDAAYPKLTHANEGNTLFTVHVYSGGAPLPKAQVLVGSSDSGNLKQSCETNQRGRCVVRFREKPLLPLTFVAKKDGYQTQSLTSRVTHQGTLRFNLEAGQSLDVFAFTKAYNHTRGLSGVAVNVQGRLVGETDQFGHFTYLYSGKKSDFLDITLRPKAYLPEEFQTDFVVSGPMSLVRYFAPSKAPPARIALLRIETAGELSEKDADALYGGLESRVRQALKAHLFAAQAFQEVPMSVVTASAKAVGKPLAKLVREGWQGTDLKAHLDAVLVPTVSLRGQVTLEFSVVDSRGQVVAAAQESFDKRPDEGLIDHAVSMLAKKITRAFPFEGAVLSKEKDRVQINLGYSSGRMVEVGDELDVYGVQASPKGQAKTHQKIATLRVSEVLEDHSLCVVRSLEARADVARGDLVVLRPRAVPTMAGAKIRVTGNLSGDQTVVPLSQANVYLNDAWLGATDESGRLFVSSQAASGKGKLKVIKHGFLDFAKEANLKKSATIDVVLRRETAFLRIESKPPQATVKVDGRVVGKTPLYTPIPVPSGFVKLEAEGIAGYKTYSQVLELDQGTLDLTGANTIQLEEDFRGAAQKLLSSGKVKQAALKLSDVPAEHSDYLFARHELGEIYLTLLGEPAKAAEAFAQVTSQPAVRQFNDKRFIGSHINEGVALFLTAEKLAASEPEVAKAHYQKAVEVLEGVMPQLRFIAKDQYGQAVHNANYHLSLARHKLWNQTKDPAMLQAAYRSWRDYLEGAAKALPEGAGGSSYLDNAQVYYGQVKASVESGQETAIK